jgi:hypothetical protein
MATKTEKVINFIDFKIKFLETLLEDCKGDLQRVQLQAQIVILKDLQNDFEVYLNN